MKNISKVHTWLDTHSMRGRVSWRNKLYRKIGAAAIGEASIKRKQEKNRILSQRTWHANLVKSCNLIKIFNLQQNVLYLHLSRSRSLTFTKANYPISVLFSCIDFNLVCSLILPRTKLCSKLALKRPAEYFILSPFPILCVSLYLHTFLVQLLPLASAPILLFTF